MNLINSSAPIQYALRCLAPLASLMPKTIHRLRYARKAGTMGSLRHPHNLQEVFTAQLFDVAKDKKHLQVWGDLSDKVKVREYVIERLGKDICPKIYGVWEKAEDIDFDAIPVPCVIKTNNGCGTNIVVRSREDINAEAMRRKLAHWLKYPYGALSGQPHYSVIKPLIFAEEYLKQSDKPDELPYDYKFFCFDGEPRFILFYTGRKVNGHLTYDTVFDTDWNEKKGIVNSPAKELFPRPDALDEMTEMARKLSKGHKLVRVDFYCIEGRPVFGEMTFTPDVYTNFTLDFLKGEAMQYLK